MISVFGPLSEPIVMVIYTLISRWALFNCLRLLPFFNSKNATSDSTGIELNSIHHAVIFLIGIEYRRLAAEETHEGYRCAEKDIATLPRPTRRRCASDMLGSRYPSWLQPPCSSKMAVLYYPSVWHSSLRLRLVHCTLQDRYPSSPRRPQRQRNQCLATKQNVSRSSQWSGRKISQPERMGWEAAILRGSD